MYFKLKCGIIYQILHLLLYINMFVVCTMPIKLLYSVVTTFLCTNNKTSRRDKSRLLTRFKYV